MVSWWTISPFVLAMSLGLVTIFGDRLVATSQTSWQKAIFDNATHGVIGLLTWAIIVLSAKQFNAEHVIEIIACGVLASAVDIDHFIAARSFSLEVNYAEAATLWIITGVISSAIILLMLLVLLLMFHVKRLNARINFLTPEEGEHAFRAPVIQPDEALAKRGYAQYGGSIASGLESPRNEIPDYTSIGSPAPFSPTKSSVYRY